METGKVWTSDKYEKYENWETDKFRKEYKNMADFGKDTEKIMKFGGQL